MKVRINKDEVDGVIRVVISDQEYLENQLKELREQIETLKNIWQGEDAAAFYKKAESYINFLNFVPKTYENLSSIMDTVNTRYQIIDSTYAEIVKKAVINHE